MTQDIAVEIGQAIEHAECRLRELKAQKDILNRAVRRFSLPGMSVNLGQQLWAVYYRNILYKPSEWMVKLYSKESNARKEYEIMKLKLCRDNLKPELRIGYFFLDIQGVTEKGDTE